MKSSGNLRSYRLVGWAAFLLLLASVNTLHAAAWLGSDSVAVVAAWRKLPSDCNVKSEFHGGKLSAVEFSGKALRSADLLFSLLDSIDGGGGWSEIDPDGYLEKELSAEIKGARQSWFSFGPGRSAVVAVLHGDPMRLHARILPGFRVAPPVPLEFRFHGDMAVFADFERYTSSGNCDKNDPCNLIHRDDNNVQAIVAGRHVRMGYRNPDAVGLDFPTGFLQLSEPEQARRLSEYRDFFQHEYAVMLRAFIQTTPGMFNWQAWHWNYFTSKGFLGKQELYSIFASGHAPEMYRVMQLRCKGGETVRFESNGNGQFFLEIQ